MTCFRDHAAAMRVIGTTFSDHQLSDQPCQSWMVRRPQTGNHVSSSAYHFVVTWLPGRALIVTGDIGNSVYSGMTKLDSLDDTVRLVREADIDYLSRYSTHTREFDAAETAHKIVSHAYRVARTYRDFDWFKPIIQWADQTLCNRNDPELCHEDRKAACRELLDQEIDEATFYCEFEDVEICTSWPSAAYWHYEALRTWANLMARSWSDGKIAGDSASSSAGEAA